MTNEMKSAEEPSHEVQLDINRLLSGDVRLLFPEETAHYLWQELLSAKSALEVQEQKAKTLSGINAYCERMVEMTVYTEYQKGGEYAYKDIIHLISINYTEQK